MLLRAISERKMKDFPSCFGESGVQVADSSSAPSKSGQNLVTCVYQCRLRRLPCFITVTWSRNLMGQGLGVTIENSFSQCLCRVDIKPWLFSKRKGLKTIEAAVDSDRIDIYWDVSSAKFGSGPEPVEGFYLAVGFNREIVLLLGDMRKEVCRKFDGDRGLILRSNEAVFVAKKEHVFGKKFYCVKAQFIGDGELHDVGIECDTSVDVKEHCLVMKVDGKVVMQVKRLKWKFRGNGTILVDGLPVEVYWDVHDWLFGGGMGNAVFMFQTCLSAEKLWNSSSQPVFDLSCSSSRFRECQSQECWWIPSSSRRINESAQRESRCTCTLRYPFSQAIRRPVTAALNSARVIEHTQKHLLLAIKACPTLS